ncbi:MAG: M20/M25/M40 family metallo-hydrolase [Thermoguttaceae bacterium]|nr:M20/M25/M40 family metallo-hydrolase [Thermoguttaceae bacterium]
MPGRASKKSSGSTISSSRGVLSKDALLPEPDLKQAETLLMQMLALPGRSGQERPVLEFIVRKLRAAGLPKSAILWDPVHQRSPLGGQVGNLVVRLPGTVRGARRLLMAHVDTVPLCVGARPVRRGDFIVPADSTRGLGADNRAGATVILSAALEVVGRGLEHPPLVFLWTVQEEVGLLGARFAKLSLLGKPKLAFNFDGGPSHKITIGATGSQRMRIRIVGQAAHAGVSPQEGVSAIAAAGLAIAWLQQEGWHGLVEKPDGRGTANIGIIHGGEATNVVTPEVEVQAEARSHDLVFRRKIVQTIREAFERSAAQVQNIRGQQARIHWEEQSDYEAFRLAEDQPCVLAAEAAIRSVGATPERSLSNGGLDANWMTHRGIPTVTLGCGQVNPHTCQEYLVLPEFWQACRVALRLATGTESLCPILPS